MKTISKILGITTLAVLIYSCSSVKVADSWKDVKIPNIKSKNILVVSKTDNETARVQFETDMVNALNNKGYNSIESFIKFPEIKPTNKMEKGQVKEVINKLKNDGIGVVMMTVLRDVQEYTKETTSSATYKVTSHPFYLRRGYYRGFNTYYHTTYIDANPITSIQETGNKYILETVVYDLTQPEDKELLSVITTEIDNPATLGPTSEDFAKKIVNELSK